MAYTDPPPPQAPPPRRWGRERTLGQLFSASFAMFGAHKRWLIPLTVCGAVPGLAWSLLAQDLFGYDSQVLIGKLIGHRLPGTHWHGTPALGTLLLVSLASTLLLIACTAFAHAALLGMLAAAGRGAPISLGAAFAHGLAGLGRYLATQVWVGLRVLAWIAPAVGLIVVGFVLLAGRNDLAPLLLVLGFLALIPLGVLATIRAYAWLFAVPARMADDAPGPEAAVRLSSLATLGRKGYLFLYNLLISLIIGGVSGILGGIVGAAVGVSAARGGGGGGGPHVALQVVEGITTLLGAGLGMVLQLGVWLAWADAVAPWDPRSPAAAYAMGVTGKPFPTPNLRG